MSRSRLARSVFAALLAGALVAPPAFAAAKPGATPEERASSVARPAVVYVEVSWKAWVRDISTGQLWLDDPTSIVSSCSGFVVNPAGYIVTAGHCVDPGIEGVEPAFFNRVIETYDANGWMKGTQEQFYSQLTSSSVLEGSTAGTPPDRQVYVQRGVATSGLRSGQAFAARVVSFGKNSEGDVALLKVDQPDMASILLASESSISVGTPILAVGYPGSAEAVSDATFEPTYKDGKVSTKRTVGGVPFYEISAAATPGMSGGPVITLDARVGGLVSFGPAQETQAFNFIASTQLIRETLTRNGVTNKLGRIDNLYRQGLDAYYGGDYRKAVDRFDDLLGLSPSHQQAQEFRQKAKEGLRTTGGGLPLVPVVAMLVLLCAGGAGGWFVVRRRKARAPVAPGPALDMQIESRAPDPAPLVESSEQQPAPERVEAKVAAAGPANGEVARQPAVPGPQVRVCPSCGTWPGPGARFCASCGGRVDV